ncbi:MAG: RNase P subunit p30 family protein [Betaproteobacteria bacterium]
MKRNFCDLHLRVSPVDAKVQRFMAKAAQLGYKQIGIPFSAPPTQTELIDIKNFAENSGLDFVTRADFKPRNQEDLMRFLRKYRRQFEVICILCDNKDVARQAAKDHRVDILNFPSLDYKKRFFDRAEAELACSTRVAVEIDLKPLLVLEGPPRTRLLYSLRRETGIASEFRVPILLSSGIGEEVLMRKPRDSASLAYLFGLQENQALDAVSTNPTDVVLRNRQKLDPNFVAPGITILKGGKSQ